jgi:5-methyltetrahydrofolate--homocysteine methyltransferase
LSRPHLVSHIEIFSFILKNIRIPKYVVGMSALLTSTMPEMKYTIQSIESAGLRSQIKTILGGAPVTESFAKEIGVDGYALNATSAVDLVKKLIGK